MTKLYAPLALALVAVLRRHRRRAAAGAGKKKLYCWNEGGRKVCGDALPAECGGQRAYRDQRQERHGAPARSGAR